MDVVITSRPGHIGLDPADLPDKRLADFTSRFTSATARIWQSSLIAEADSIG